LDETAAQPGEPRIATIPIADLTLNPFICILVFFHGLLRSAYCLLLVTNYSVPDEQKVYLTTVSGLTAKAGGSAVMETT
jgi:hypothetical protein